MIYMGGKISLRLHVPALNRRINAGTWAYHDLYRVEALRLRLVDLIPGIVWQPLP